MTVDVKKELDIFLMQVSSKVLEKVWQDILDNGSSAVTVSVSEGIKHIPKLEFYHPNANLSPKQEKSRLSRKT